MPPRLTKRQQRELEELEALGEPGPSKSAILPDGGSDDDNDVGVGAGPAPGGFSAVSPFSVVDVILCLIACSC